MKRLVNILFVPALIALLLPACEKEEDDGLLRDIDGNKYETVQISGRTWMAENLKVSRDPNGNPLETYCYGGRDDRCAEFGRLYTWESAGKACPTGWRLPDLDDWTELEISLGMDPAEAAGFGWRGTDEGTRLKEGGGSGFDALLAGYKDGIIEWDGRFFDMGYFGSFWSSAEVDSISAVGYFVYISSAKIMKTAYDKTSAFSVRCIKDD